MFNPVDNAGLVCDVMLKFFMEMFQESAHWHRRCVTQRANDAVHVFVERELGLKDAFWGMVKAGRHPEEIAGTGRRPDRDLPCRWATRGDDVSQEGLHPA